MWCPAMWPVVAAILGIASAQVMLVVMVVVRTTVCSCGVEMDAVVLY